MNTQKKETEKITPFLVYGGENEAVINDNNIAGDFVYVRQKHRDALLRILYEHKNVSHAELAEKLKISASGLNAVIKKLNDVEEKTVKYTKIGKYKYYNLTEAGRSFVENVLMLSREKERENHLKEVWDIYQDMTGDLWEESFMRLFETVGKTAEEAENEIEAAFCEFIHSFVAFYNEAPESGTEFIEELIQSDSIRQKIIAYAVSMSGGGESLMVLNNILYKDSAMAYIFLDDLFELALEKNELLLANNYHINDIKAFGNMIREIESTVLHALVMDEEKEYLHSKWMQQGLEQQLAFYAAEKYRVLKLKLRNRYAKG